MASFEEKKKNRKSKKFIKGKDADLSSIPAPLNIGSTGLFGQKLEDVLKRADHEGEMVPMIVKWAVQALYWSSMRYTKGLHMQGIFRESGSNDTVNLWKEAFDDSGFVDSFLRNNTIENPFYILHPNDVASVLKLYLRSLPEPLMRFENYSPIVEVVKTIKFGDENETIIILKIIKECISSTLPKTYSRLLYAILRLLQQCSKLSDVNKMAPLNLGIVFGQCLFRQEEITAQMLQDAQHLNKAVALMIENTHMLFDLENRPDLRKLERTLFHSGAGINGATVELVIQGKEPENETLNALFGVDEAEYMKQGVETDAKIKHASLGTHTRMSSADRKTQFRFPGAVPTAGGSSGELMAQLKKRQSVRVSSSDSMSLDERLAMEKKKREEERRQQQEEDRANLTKRFSSGLLKRQQSMDSNQAQHASSTPDQSNSSNKNNSGDNDDDDDDDEDFDFSADVKPVVTLAPGQSSDAVKDNLFRGLLQREKWQELHDQNSNRRYYFHEPTRTTSWELPESIITEFQQLASQVDQQAKQQEKSNVGEQIKVQASNELPQRKQNGEEERKKEKQQYQQQQQQVRTESEEKKTPAIPARKPPMPRKPVTPPPSKKLTNKSQIVPALKAFCNELRRGDNKDVGDRLAALTGVVNKILEKDSESSASGNDQGTDAKDSNEERLTQQLGKQRQEHVELQKQWEVEKTHLHVQAQKLQQQVEEQKIARMVLKKKLTALADDL